MTDQEAAEQLGALGRQALEAWKDTRPRMCADLEAQGKLHLFALEQEQAAADAWERAVEAGEDPDLAKERILPEYLFWPAEEEMPLLGQRARDPNDRLDPATLG